MIRSLVIALAFVSVAGIHAQELAEGTWGGTMTRQNANNPRPQRLKFALEIKKMSDPHWAWRPGSGDTWNIAVIHQQGRSQAIGLELKGEVLSFSYRLQDTTMACELTRQADGAFEGTCVSDGDARTFRLSLTPAKAPAK
jgi:hypothetical protein